MNGVRGFGHESILVDKYRDSDLIADAAIVNLGSADLRPAELVKYLRENGVIVIGHAGHKEKDLLQLGKECGCDELVTNGLLSAKLNEILEKVAKQVLDRKS